MATQTFRSLALTCLVIFFANATAHAADPFAELGQAYAEQTHAILKRYCLDCHSTASPEGELDLERFGSLSEVRRDTGVWLKVVEMLDNGEMPPKDADQPTADEKSALRGWVEKYLQAEALANAGDPGPVVLRRLNNAEYTYTVRDLTGVALGPAREFPADGAAGEGFTNAGAAMVMSPALLTKYLNAAKEISAHAVLLPDGFRFSSSSTRSDWTNETLANIRALYRQHTDSAGASQVNLQGVIFDTNDGGRLPLERYLAATLADRAALQSNQKSVTEVAETHGVNAKYLGILWNTLNASEPSPLLDTIRAHWRESKVEDAGKLAAEIGVWQNALWRFTSVGHIGKVGGPKAWQEPVTPLTAKQELRAPLPAPNERGEVTIYLATGDAGDGHDQDVAILERPRLVAPGRPDVLLRDVRTASAAAAALREQVASSAERALAAVAEAETAADAPDLTQLAAKHDVPPVILSAWLNYFGIGLGGNAKIESHLIEQQTNIGGHAFVSGWGPAETPNVAANASDEMVRIPGNLKPHGVVMHPSPTLSIVAGWQSPVTAAVRIAGVVQHAHPECGNGVTWSLELRRGGSSRRFASGIAHGGGVVSFGPFEEIAVRTGDVVALLIGPRDGNHSCDLTAVDLMITAAEATWDLSADVSPDILAGNPHADRLGNAGVWHFFTEPISADASHAIPADSLVAKWRAASTAAERQALAGALQQLLQTGPTVKEGPDAQLYQQLTSLGGPLLSAAYASNNALTTAAADDRWGLPRARFGKQADGPEIDDASLTTAAPEVIEVVLPADLAAGAEFVATGYLAPGLGADGSVQLQVLAAKPDSTLSLQPSTASATGANAVWSSDTEELAFNTPVIVNDGSAARARIEKAYDEFRAVFPAALCYTKIVPVDEVVTLTLFHREDDALCRLMLDDAQSAELDRQWAQLRFVSQDALTLVDAFEQLMEFATQDADPGVFAPLREPINARAAAFRQAMIDAEPRQLDALIDFAALAYRRPLTAHEVSELRGLYAKLRSEELPHDEAFRFTLARVLVAPEFLYRLEESNAAVQDGPIASRPIDDWELATRLSYFLWSTTPDAELRGVAASGNLREPEVLRAQAKRMMQDPRIERLAREFACQWLHIYEFDTLDEKSERHFPEFAELRGAMYEEAIRYFTDAFQHDASILNFFDGDHTFVNDRLAAFYGLPANESGADGWRRVSGLHQQGRGGVLGFAATLAKQSGASRTSPILRGNWVSEVLLGEKLPKPPAGVPVLPDDDSATETMTVRQLVEKHVSDEGCAKCHRRIDPLGFALEEFDAIGRRRDQDTAGRAIDAKSTLPDGTEVNGVAGLRDYLVQHRRDALVRQFCRKLLGYALGRSVQLSDQPLLDEMMTQLAANDYRFSVAVECVLSSNQFLAIRGIHHGGTESTEGGGGGGGSAE